MLDGKTRTVYKDLSSKDKKNKYIIIVNRPFGQSVTWFKIGPAWTWVTRWDSQNKVKSSWYSVSWSGVEVPLFNLCASMVDKIMQRLHPSVSCLKIFILRNGSSAVLSETEIPLALKSSTYFFILLCDCCKIFKCVSASQLTMVKIFFALTEFNNKFFIIQSAILISYLNHTYTVQERNLPLNTRAWIQ